MDRDVCLSYAYHVARKVIFQLVEYTVFGFITSEIETKYTIFN